MAIGVAARFVTVSHLWLDESVSVNIASLPLGGITDALRRDGHPPLYYWLLHAWMSVFGDGDIAVRSLSGILSVATLPLIWAIGHRLAGRKAAASALVVAALSPYAVRYGTEARMYALVMFLVAAGYLLYQRVLERPRLREAVLLGLVTGALLWTHYWALYLLVATGLALVVRWWRAPSGRRVVATVMAGLVVGAVVFLPWVPVLLDQAEHTGTPWGAPPKPTSIASLTLQDLGGGNFAEAQLYGITMVILLLIAALAHSTSEGGSTVELAGRLHPRLRDEVTVGVATLMVGAAAGYATGGAYASRYASVVVPLILAAVGVGLSLLPRGPIRWGLVAAVVGFSLIGLTTVVRTDRTQAQELADTIAAQAGTDDMVVVCPDQLGPSLARALRGAEADLPLVPYPLAGDARFVDWRDYEARNAVADPEAFAKEVLERAGGGTIWLVWKGSYRTLEGQCEALVTHFGEDRSTRVMVGGSDALESASLFRFG